MVLVPAMVELMVAVTPASTLKVAAPIMLACQRSRSSRSS